MSDRPCRRILVLRRYGAVGILLSLCGCGNLLGLEQLPGGRADASVGDAPVAEKFKFTDANCGACSAQCGRELEACGLDRGCAAVFRELVKCGLDDAICRAKTDRLDPVAFQGETLLALETCRRQNCAADCYGGVGFAKFADSCKCLDEKCVETSSACVRSKVPDSSSGDDAGDAGDGSAAVSHVAVGDCERRFGCVLTADAPDPAHTFACVDRFRGGDREMNDLRVCMANASCPGCTFVGGRDLGCSGRYRWRPISDEFRDWKLQVIEAPTGTPVPQAQLTVCGEGACADCLVRIGDALTDDAGVATIRIPTAHLALEVCVRVRKDGFVDGVSHVGRPVYAATNAPFQVPLLTPASLRAAADLVQGAVLEDGQAHVIVGALDCVFSGASGLTIDHPDPTDRVYYFRGGVPNAAAPSTDSRGQALLLNVAPGLHTIVARDAGKPVSEYRYHFLPGVNWAVLMPTPAP